MDKGSCLRARACCCAQPARVAGARCSGLWLVRLTQKPFAPLPSTRPQSRPPTTIRPENKCGVSPCQSRRQTF